MKLNEGMMGPEGIAGAKSALITGANRGIGFGAALGLARKGCRVLLACRDPEAAERACAAIAEDPAARDLGGRALLAPPLDLGSLASVRAFARALSSEGPSLDVLVNNAGALFPRREITIDGFERSFAVNFLGPFLLTRLLLPRIRPGGRIVNLTSVAGLYGRFDPGDLVMERGYGELRAYARSKLAALMISLELAERLRGRIAVNALHPGIVNTRILTLGRWFDPLADALFRPFVRDAYSGAAPIVDLAWSERLEGVSGLYFSRFRAASLPRRIADPAARRKLWELACRLADQPREIGS